MLARDVTVFLSIAGMTVRIVKDAGREKSTPSRRARRDTQSASPELRFLMERLPKEDRYRRRRVAQEERALVRSGVDDISIIVRPRSPRCNAPVMLSATMAGTAMLGPQGWPDQLSHPSRGLYPKGLQRKRPRWRRGRARRELIWISDLNLVALVRQGMDSQNLAYEIVNGVSNSGRPASRKTFHRPDRV